MDNKTMEVFQMNTQNKKDVIRILSMLQDNMHQTIILFGFKQNLIDTATKVNEELNEMVVER